MTFPSAHTSSSVSYLLYQVFLTITINICYSFHLDPVSSTSITPFYPSIQRQFEFSYYFLVLSLPSLLKPLWSDFCRHSVMEFDSMFLYWWQLLSLTPFPPNPGELIRRLTCSLLWCPWVFQTWPYLLVIIKTNTYLVCFLWSYKSFYISVGGLPYSLQSLIKGVMYFFIPSWYV